MSKQPLDQTESKSQQQPSKAFFLTKGFAIVIQITGMILGPLIVMGGIGYYIGQRTGNVKMSLLVAFILGFIISNFLIYKRTAKLADSL